MKHIYLDNAATTALDQRVLDQMLPYFTQDYGNPSSIHAAGRKTRLAIEESRKKVAKLLHCKPAEIFFTSCGTESTNTVLQAAVNSLGCKKIITSPIEHHATLHTAEVLCQQNEIELHFIKHDSTGCIDYDHLINLVKDCSAEAKTLVTIMHANNEIGVVNDISKIGKACAEYGAFFHSDMVQTIGHMPIELSKLPVHFASASAHKFHGPKGSGMLYVQGDVKLNPFVLGGGQERNMRAGTENVAGIVGFAAALDLAIGEMQKENEHTQMLKDYAWQQLQDTFPEIGLNGCLDKSLPRVLNVLLPANEKTEMLQMSLDIKGIAISGGSACSSGALGGSHVINTISEKPGVPLRISFCKSNTKDDIDYLINTMKEVLN